MQLVYEHSVGNASEKTAAINSKWKIKPNRRPLPKMSEIYTYIYIYIYTWDFVESLQKWARSLFVCTLIKHSN